MPVFVNEAPASLSRNVSNPARRVVRMMTPVAKAMFARLGLDVRRRGDPFDVDLYRELYDAHTLARRPFYNVGSGAFWHPHWTNVDYVSDWYSSVQRDVVPHDLMSSDPLPIPDASAEVIYSSHTINHVTEEAVDRFFREAHRALRPGGTLRVTTCSNPALDYRALVSGDRPWFYWDDWYSSPGTWESAYRAPANSVPLEERWLHHVATQLAPNNLASGPTTFTAHEIRRILDERGLEGALDHFTGMCTFNPKFPGDHLTWWSSDKLIRHLHAAGFEDVSPSGYGQSALPILRNTRLFDDAHPHNSVYVEATR
jgi:SAM-dependent methyltransferase